MDGPVDGALVDEPEAVHLAQNVAQRNVFQRGGQADPEECRALAGLAPPRVRDKVSVVEPQLDVRERVRPLVDGVRATGQIRDLKPAPLGIEDGQLVVRSRPAARRRHGHVCRNSAPTGHRHRPGHIRGGAGVTSVIERPQDKTNGAEPSVARERSHARACLARGPADPRAHRPLVQRGRRGTFRQSQRPRHAVGQVQDAPNDLGVRVADIPVVEAGRVVEPVPEAAAARTAAHGDADVLRRREARRIGRRHLYVGATRPEADHRQATAGHRDGRHAGVRRHGSVRQGVSVRIPEVTGHVQGHPPARVEALRRYRPDRLRRAIGLLDGHGRALRRGESAGIGSRHRDRRPALRDPGHGKAAARYRDGRHTRVGRRRRVRERISVRIPEVPGNVHRHRPPRGEALGRYRADRLRSPVRPLYRHGRALRRGQAVRVRRRHLRKRNRITLLLSII